MKANSVEFFIGGDEQNKEDWPLLVAWVLDVLKKIVKLIVTENDADLSSTRGEKRCVIRILSPMDPWTPPPQEKTLFS